MMKALTRLSWLKDVANCQLQFLCSQVIQLCLNVDWSQVTALVETDCTSGWVFCFPFHYFFYLIRFYVDQESSADKQTTAGNLSTDSGGNVQKLESIPVPRKADTSTDSNSTHPATCTASDKRNDGRNSTAGQNILVSKPAEAFKARSDSLAAGKGISEISSTDASKESLLGIKLNDQSSQEIKKNEELKSVMINSSPPKSTADVSAVSFGCQDSSSTTHIPKASKSNSSDVCSSIVSDKSRSGDRDTKTLAKDSVAADAGKVAEKQKMSSILIVT